MLTGESQCSGRSCRWWTGWAARSGPLGPVASNEDAKALIEPGSIHAAVLDMDLGGVASFPTAHRLKEFGIPFVFVTGNNEADLQDGLADSPIHTKPVHYPRLIEQLKGFASLD